MQIVIDELPPRDYRRIFGFMIYYPILLHEDASVKDCIDGIYKQNLVPIAIITDRENMFFKLLKERTELSFYNGTKTIIIPMGFNQLYMS